MKKITEKKTDLERVKEINKKKKIKQEKEEEQRGKVRRWSCRRGEERKGN